MTNSPFKILDLPHKVKLPYGVVDSSDLMKYCLEVFGPQTVGKEIQYYVFYSGAKFRNEVHATMFALRWIRE